VRAKETAEILGARLGLPVQLDPDLRERNWGSWEGLTPGERDAVTFEGEAPEEHRERMLGAVRRIAERHPGERVVVVTHGGSMRRIQAAVMGVAMPVVANCETWGCVHEDGAFRPID
jgi:alpha-ribazole phosphatase